MNIAIFTNNYLPNHYGVTNSIESFRKQFEKMGHTVYIFAPAYKNYTDNNPNVFRYPALDVRYRIKFPIPIPYSRKIGRKIKELKIDIIHSQHPNLLGTVAYRLAKKRKIPLIFTWHTLYDMYVSYVPFPFSKLAKFWIIGNAVKYANKVDQVIVPTNSVKKIIKEWGVKNKNIIDIPTGVEEKFFDNSDAKKIRKKLKISSDKKIILSISRLTEEKNVSLLLKMVAGVLQKRKDTIFVLGGEGYLLKKLKEEAKNLGVNEKIIFPGVIKKNEIKNYFAMADIFVYASKSETQGMIISEAMFAGLPIVALDASGVRDLVLSGETGKLILENEQFEKELRKILDNNDLLKKFSQKAKERAEQKYTDKVCALKMLDVYKKLLKNYLSV